MECFVKKILNVSILLTFFVIGLSSCAHKHHSHTDGAKCESSQKEKCACGDKAKKESCDDCKKGS